MEAIPRIYVRFTSCFSTLTTATGNISSLKTMAITASAIYEQLAIDKKEYAHLCEKVLESQDAVTILQAELAFKRQTMTHTNTAKKSLIVSITK